MVTHIHGLDVEMRGGSLYVKGEFTNIITDRFEQANESITWRGTTSGCYCTGTLEDVVVKYAEERLGLRFSHIHHPVGG